MTTLLSLPQPPAPLPIPPFFPCMTTVRPFYFPGCSYTRYRVGERGRAGTLTGRQKQTGISIRSQKDKAVDGGGLEHGWSSRSFFLVHTKRVAVLPMFRASTSLITSPFRAPSYHCRTYDPKHGDSEAATSRGARHPHCMRRWQIAECYDPDVARCPSPSRRQGEAYPQGGGGGKLPSASYRLSAAHRARSANDGHRGWIRLRRVVHTTGNTNGSATCSPPYRNTFWAARDLSPHRNTMCTHRRVVSTMPTLSFPTGMFCAPPLWCSVFEVVASRACRVPRRFKTRWQVRMVAPRIRMVGKGPGWSRTKLAKYPLTDPVKRPEVELSEVPAGHA